MEDYEEYDLSDRDKPFLGLKMKFDYPSIVEYLIIIIKDTGIVLCVYSLESSHEGCVTFL